MTEGWIKLHRKILDNPILASDFNFSLFVRHLLLKAVHKPHTVSRGGEEVTLQPGQLYISIRSLARSLGVGEKKIRDRLVTFKNRRMLTTKTDALGTVVTICNWELYQNIGTEDDALTTHQLTHQRRTNDALNNNDKNDKNDSNKDSVPPGLVETAAPNSTKARPHKAIAEKMVEVFNHHLGDVLQRARVTPRRVRTLSTALKDDFSDDGRLWSDFCRKVAASDFLTGRSSDWRASLDWIIKPANRTKILEGNYDNRRNENGRFDAERIARDLAADIERDGGFGETYGSADETFDVGEGDALNAHSSDRPGNGCPRDGQGLLEIPDWFDQDGRE